MNERTYSRYTTTDVARGRFYQMPKFLFDGDLKKGLSNDAKVLYSLLKDRHELSLQNNWVNGNKEVYLVYTREDMADMLGCSQPTLRKSIKQLINLGLMEEERMGLNRANRLYLTAVTLVNTGVKDSFSPVCNNLSVQNEKDLQSGVKESFVQECKELSPNDTNINNTDSNDTDINHINPSETADDGYDVIEIREHYEKVIKKNIEYDYMIQYKFGWKKDVDNIVGIMADICALPDSASVKVNGNAQTVSVVRERFLQIDSMHLEYIMDALDENPSNVRNIRAYLITTVFNAPTTISQYYRSKVNHDTHRGRM